jgi:cobalt transporter subunit CbtA
MSLFRPTFLSAALAGLIAGVFLAVVQAFTVVPLIMQAEEYEHAAEHAKSGAAGQSAVGQSGVSHSAGQSPAPATDQGHRHGEGEAWSPEDGLERTLYTTLFDVLAGIGFGLILAGGYVLRGHVDAAQGLLWGLGGFAAFNLAPALGLPPELPGTESAGLAARQTWWLATVLLTGVGLGIIAFVPRWSVKLVGLALLALPHAFGAPHPSEPGSVAPAELQRQFAVVTLVANALFWMVLGAVSGYLFNRFHQDDGLRDVEVSQS